MDTTTTPSAPRSNYKTPAGMKRLWTVTGKTGVGRLLSDKDQATHIDISLHTSSKGTAFKKPMHILRPTSSLDAVAMQLENRPDGKPNYLQAIQKCVNGENLIFVAQTDAAPAPVASEAPAAEAPVAEVAPAAEAAPVAA